MNVYQTADFPEALRQNVYPGRGILIGITPDQKSALALYFIMGRSTNSRNRVFAVTPDGIRTEAYDPSKLQDPSLIIYHPVRRLGRALIVTNGDQTDTVRDYLESGRSFEEALNTRAFEPDAPNFTPRISALLCADGSYLMSILKSADACGSACNRQTFSYAPVAGVGHFLHTYAGDGDPIPSFIGEPERMAIPAGDLEEFGESVWESLNFDNKVSLYLEQIDLNTGAHKCRIWNKNA